MPVTYHESAKRLNFQGPVCTFVGVLNAQYISEHIPYKAELTARIAGGNDHCIMKIKKKDKRRAGRSLTGRGEMTPHLSPYTF
jgi:hypothetical protein